MRTTLTLLLCCVTACAADEPPLGAPAGESPGDVSSVTDAGATDDGGVTADASDSSGAVGDGNGAVGDAGGALGDAGGADGAALDARAPAARLAINEVAAASVDGSADWIELVVVGDSAVDLSGWTLVDDGAGHAPSALPTGTLAPGDFLVILATDEPPAGGSAFVPFKLGKDDAVTLARGGEAVETLDWEDGDAVAGTSWGRLPDGTGAAKTLAPTPGEPNQELAGTPITSPWIADRVVPVEIALAAADWQTITDDPLAEEYVAATLTYDGITIESIGVRPKGNSSLKSVAGQGNTHRFSFKVDTNLYVAGQSLLGAKKLNFNNGFKDPTLLREHVAYALLREAGVPAPRTTFVDLTIGGEHLGLYLMVEHVDDVFLGDHFPEDDGTLYKPEPPAGNLTWQGGDAASYAGLEVEQNEETDHAAFMALVSALEAGDEAAIEAALDVDSALLQLAFHALLANLDSYLGPGHNFYLYETEGRLAMIPWDTNEAFGTFTCGCDRAGIIGLLIDEPVCGPLDGKPLLRELLKVPAWRDAYRGHLRSLVDGPFAEAAMQTRVDAAAALIRSTVESSPSLFYPVAEFEQSLTQDAGQGKSAVIGLMAFVKERGAAVRAQLDGDSPADADGVGSCGAAGTGGGGGGPKPCGDGVCDPFESANPGLCPLDCP